MGAPLQVRQLLGSHLTNMALIKTKTNRGFRAEYWVITKETWDKIKNQTLVEISLYKDGKTRRDNLNSFIEMKAFVFDGKLTTAECYARIKEIRTEPTAPTSVIKDEVFDLDDAVSDE